MHRLGNHQCVQNGMRIQPVGVHIYTAITRPSSYCPNRPLLGFDQLGAQTIGIILPLSDR